MKNSLWTEAYRPTTLDGYVFSDSTQKTQIEQWIKNQDVPNILFSGSPGTGKTTISKILCNELQIDPYDVLFINASRENSVDDMRNKITSFVSTIPYGIMRIVILDEADYLSINAQSILRGLMEQFSTSRFFLTCNYPNRVIPAIHSRCQTIAINKLQLDEFTVRMAEILVTENIEFELDVLDDYVRGCWPDLRKTINICQQNSINGKLCRPDSSNNSNSRDYRIDAIELFKTGKIREARALICSQIRPEDLEEFFVWLYNNIDLFGSNNNQKDSAILIIRRGMVQIPVACDAEILVAAILIELSQINKEEKE